MKYRTRDGDMLDQICLEYYGSIEPVPQVLEANPLLAEQPAILPAGVVINLPEVQPKEQARPVRLWD